ncbi:SCP-like protein [Teladorsagia circumcincta]|uniref:SCP-like protein n=1 Tax=Teladorsagia circumcincta TaxID=45464 RepID=A0A2G9UZF1_TELCI|nr:SCP-like protein [Teladorsagia circumcincta]
MPQNPFSLLGCDSVTDTYDGIRNQPLKVQIGIVVIAALLGFLAIGIPPLIRPSSNFDELTESGCTDSITDEVRQAFLRYHNRERSIVAKGNYDMPSPRDGYGMPRLPPAKRMYQLKYNCSLEKSALKWSKIALCDIRHSDWGVGENLYVTDADNMALARGSVKKWVREIKDWGAKSVMDFRAATAHASQIFWADTTTVGCAIYFCGLSRGGKMVTCHYYPQQFGRVLKKPKQYVEY